MIVHRATRQLLALPFVRMPVWMVLATFVWAAVTVLVAFIGPAMLIGVGVIDWLGGMLLGITLRTLLRADTRLLPLFRRRLGAAGAVYVAATIVLPLMLALLVGASGHMLGLAAAALVLALAVGISAGMGVRVSMYVWVAFPLFGALPRSLHATVLHTLTHSPWVPLLALLLAALLIDYTLRPLLTANDRADDDSPMQAVADGRKPTTTSASGTPRRRGAIGKQLATLLDATARHNLVRALARFRRKPNAAARMRLIRAVLLPHDNPAGITINMAVIIVFALLYMLLVPDARHWDVSFLAAYAVVLGMSRFTAVGQGMLKMRPNLADLYMTLGPETRSDFQATMADALLWLVAVTTFNMLAFTLLIAVTLHAPEPGELLLTTLIVGVGVAFGALAAHLIGPTSKGGRIGMQLVLMFVAIAIYELVLWLMHHFGAAIGGLAGIVICLPVGLGAWHIARRIYLARRPIFDAPLD